MRLYSLQMAFDSAQADTSRPFETAFFFVLLRQKYSVNIQKGNNGLRGSQETLTTKITFS